MKSLKELEEIRNKTLSQIDIRKKRHRHKDRRRHGDLRHRRGRAPRAYRVCG